MKLKEIADRINAHLVRFSSDLVLSRRVDGRARFFNAGAYDSGRFVMVRYISYQGNSSMSKAQATEYLSWLDAGNVGTYHNMMTAARS